MKNLPNVAVHDIKVHPRDNDLILGTHGRSIWIFDDATPIQQMNSTIASSAAHLFDVRPALRFTSRFHKYGVGDKQFAGPNPPYGALVTYYLKDKPDEKTAVKLQVLDSTGKVIRELKNVPKESGLNRASWDLRHEGPQTRRPPTEEELAFSAGPVGPRVLPGAYILRLMVGDKTLDKKVDVKLDPSISVSTADLQMQLDQSLKLRDMQSTLTEGIRAVDSAKEQLEQISKVVKDRMPEAPEELTKTIADYQKQVDELQGTLVRPEGGLGFGSGSARFSEKVGGLFFAIEGVNAGPTRAQQEYFTELVREFPERVAEINRFVTQAIPKLNETLRKHNAPTVVPGKAVEPK
jgi:hypothetical protein